MGVPQEPERPCRLHVYKEPEWGNRHLKPQAPGLALQPSGRHETATQAWYRQVKETKRGGKDGRKSEHPGVPLKQGNSPERTLWREADAGSSDRRKETWQVH